MVDDNLLLEKVVANDIEEVKRLVENGANVNSRNEYITERTALVEAIYGGSLEIVKYLVEKGAYLDFDIDDNVLCEIKGANYLNIEEYLRVNLDLINAVINGNLNQVKSCLDEGACINLRDKDGFTPLMYAVINGDLEIVKYLVEKGANIDSKDKDGFTPLIHAAYRSNIEMVIYLVERGANIHSEDKDGFTPLMYAVINGDLEIVKYLVDSGAYVNHYNKGTSTILMLAVSHDNVDIVKYLTTQNIYVNFTDNQGNTALIYAVINGNMEIIKCLVENGAYVNHKNKNEYSAFTYAINKNDVVLVKYLADNIIKTDDLCSPEDIAWMLNWNEGYQEVLEYLMKHGVKLYSDNIPIESVITYAAQNNNLDIANYVLDEQTADSHSKVNLEYVYRNVKIGNSGNIPTESVITYAAQNNNLDIANYVLDEQTVDSHSKINLEYVYKNVIIGICRLGQDKNEIFDTVNNLSKDKDILLELVKGVIRKIDIIPEKEGYKIILRKSRFGRVYKRFMYDGHKITVIKKREKTGFSRFSIVYRAPKKLLKKVFRYFIMRDITYNKLLEIRKEKLNEKNYYGRNMLKTNGINNL